MEFQYFQSSNDGDTHKLTYKYFLKVTISLDYNKDWLEVIYQVPRPTRRENDFNTEEASQHNIPRKRRLRLGGDDKARDMNIDNFRNWASSSLLEMNLLRQFLTDVPDMVEKWEVLTEKNRANLLEATIGFLNMNYNHHPSFLTIKQDHIYSYYKNFGKPEQTRDMRHVFKALDQYLDSCFDDANQEWFDLKTDDGKKGLNREKEAQEALLYLDRLDFNGIANTDKEKKYTLRKNLLLSKAKKWFLSRYNLKETVRAAFPGKKGVGIVRFLIRWVPEMIAFIAVWAVMPKIINGYFHGFQDVSTIRACMIQWGPVILRYILRFFYIGIVVSIPVFSIWSLFDKNNRMKMEDLQLCLPRLLAGITAGYLLLMNDGVWLYIFHETPKNLINSWIWLKILFPLSAVYIYIAEEITHVRGIRLKYKGVRIFLRGLSYALLLGLIVSDLFGDSMTKSIFQEGKYNEVVKNYGIKGIYGVIYPEVLMFKAPLALFVGVILQLFWDDKKLTD